MGTSLCVQVKSGNGWMEISVYRKLNTEPMSVRTETIIVVDSTGPYRFAGEKKSWLQNQRSTVRIITNVNECAKKNWWQTTHFRYRSKFFIFNQDGWCILKLNGREMLLVFDVFLDTMTFFFYLNFILHRMLLEMSFYRWTVAGNVLWCGTRVNNAHSHINPFFTYWLTSTLPPIYRRPVLDFILKKKKSLL